MRQDADFVSSSGYPKVKAARSLDELDFRLSSRLAANPDKGSPSCQQGDANPEGYSTGLWQTVGKQSIGKRHAGKVHLASELEHLMSSVILETKPRGGSLKTRNISVLKGAGLRTRNIRNN